MAVTRLFDTAAQAEAAAQALREAGFRRDTIHIITQTEKHGVPAAMEKRGVARGNIAQYAKRVEGGAVLLAVEAPFGRAARAMQILGETPGGHAAVSDGAAADLAVEEGSGLDDAAPLSTFLGLKVLSSDPAPFSRFWNIPTLTRHQNPPAKSFGLNLLSPDPTPLSSAIGLAVLSPKAAPLSESIGLKTLSENPAPLSSALGLKTLSHKAAPLSDAAGVKQLSNDPAPLSRMLGLPVLTDDQE